MLFIYLRVESKEESNLFFHEILPMISFEFLNE